MKSLATVDLMELREKIMQRISVDVTEEYIYLTNNGRGDAVISDYQQMKQLAKEYDERGDFRNALICYAKAAVPICSYSVVVGPSRELGKYFLDRADFLSRNIEHDSNFDIMSKNDVALAFEIAIYRYRRSHTVNDKNFYEECINQWIQLAYIHYPNLVGGKPCDIRKMPEDILSEYANIYGDQSFERFRQEPDFEFSENYANSCMDKAKVLMDREDWEGALEMYKRMFYVYHSLNTEHYPSYEMVAILAAMTTAAANFNYGMALNYGLMAIKSAYYVNMIEHSEYTEKLLNNAIDSWVYIIEVDTEM